MNRYILLFILGLLSANCNGQNKDLNTESKSNEGNITETPKSSWKVNKEFDEDGNLIRYDSIYSWSSNGKFDNLTVQKRDSLIQTYKSKFFTNFSGFENQGFEDMFSEDSLFSRHFFNDDFFKSDFGNDFMDIELIRKQMLLRQKEFLEKYQSDFNKPQDEN